MRVVQKTRSGGETPSGEGIHFMPKEVDERNLVSVKEGRIVQSFSTLERRLPNHKANIMNFIS